MTKKKYNATAKYVCINTDAHSQLLAHSIESGIRIGHFVSKAILEKLAREKVKEKREGGFPQSIDKIWPIDDGKQKFTGYISEKDLDIDLDTGND